MSGISTPKLLDWLETRAQAQMDESNTLLREAQRLKLHLPHSVDPFKDCHRMQECEALAAQHMMYAVGLREEARRLKEHRRPRNGLHYADSDR